MKNSEIIKTTPIESKSAQETPDCFTVSVPVRLHSTFRNFREIDRMGTALTIDRKINSYLEKLNDKQKRAVLSVVKTMADQQPSSEAFNIPESQKQKVRQRVKKYAKTPSKLLEWEKAQKSIKVG